MRRSLLGMGLILLMLCGCKGGLRAYTQSRVIMHNSPVEDRGPLHEMGVLADQPVPEGKIALVDVDGLLVNAPLVGFSSMGENPVAVFREKLDRVAADPCCKAVVVRINSPGGGVTASDIMWQDLRTFKARTGRPVVACLMDLGTGGAYYLSTAADHIVAHPTTVTGGMGVIINFYNLQDAMMQFNIMAAPVKAGKYTDLGTPIEPRDEEGEKILQRIVDQYHERYREVVRMTRPSHDQESQEDFDGRIFTSSEALQRNLIDSIGYVEDAVAVARRLGCAPTAAVVMYHRCNDPARTPYATSPNTPVQTGLFPVSLPGFERSQLPTFLYLWQPEPTLERRATGG